MPEPAVATPPASPAPAAAPASSPAPPAASPKVTFGADQGKPPVEPPKPAETAAPASDEPKFDFGFEDVAPATPDEGLGDGEPVIADVSKPFDPTLAEKLKDSPEHLKLVKRLWYENRAFRDAGFKDAASAQNHLRDLNQIAISLGRKDGLTGLDAVKAEAQEWATVQTGFRNGDEGVVKGWMEELSPESAEKVMGHALKHYQTKNPQGWSHQMARMFMGELRAPNARGESILTALNRMAEKAGNDKEMTAAVNTIAEAVNAIDEIARKAPVAPDNNPKLSQKEQELQTKERQLQAKSLSMRIMPQITSAAEKAAKTVLNGRSLGGEEFKDFAKEIQDEYTRVTRADATFQANAKKLLEANDQDGFERLTRSNIQKNMPTAAKNINRKYGKFGSQREERRAESEARIEGPAGGSGNGNVMRYNGKLVNGGPDPAVIDWARMRTVTGSKKGAEDMMFERKFFVKGDAKNTYYY